MSVSTLANAIQLTSRTFPERFITMGDEVTFVEHGMIVDSFRTKWGYELYSGLSLCPERKTVDFLIIETEDDFNVEHGLVLMFGAHCDRRRFSS